MPETPAMLILDLSDPADVKRLWHLLSHPLLIFVHMAPPCGTCSRALERALPHLPGGGPQPLRSPEHPEGLPDLAQRLPQQHARVLTANAIYSILAQVAKHLITLNIAWAIENPMRSLIWLIPCILEVISMACVSRVSFQHCMFGGSRPKWTSLFYFPDGIFARLHRECDGQHQHAPWGQTAGGGFATALETVYPPWSLRGHQGLHRRHGA